MSKLSCLSGKGVYSKRKKNCSPNVFPFRVDPFSEGIWCAGKQTGNHKSCLLVKTTENLRVFSPRNVKTPCVHWVCKANRQHN